MQDQGQMIEKQAARPKPITLLRSPGLCLQSTTDAERILEMRTPVNTISLLSNTDVLLYGDIHSNYAIPNYLLTQIAAFKSAGVTSFGFEIHPDPKIQKVFDSINAGNLERVSEIDWSLRFGNPLVNQTLQQLAVKLVIAGIRIYPFASWDRQKSVAAQPYTQESEEQAARVVCDQTKDGKTVVLVGARHAEYRHEREYILFPHTADCIKRLGKKTKSVIFAGGMDNPNACDTDPEELIRCAARNIVRSPTYIDTSEKGIEGFDGDGILILPEVPFLAANKPIPPGRMSANNFTPLVDIQPPGLIQKLQKVISLVK